MQIGTYYLQKQFLLEVYFYLRFLEFNSVFPDELYLSTINHNPSIFKAPGSYLGRSETDPNLYPFIARLKNWGDYPFSYPCMSSYWVRQVCIWGVEDLRFISQRGELFVNKFYWDFEPTALDCMEEFYWNRTVLQFLQTLQTDSQPSLQSEDSRASPQAQSSAHALQAQTQIEELNRVPRPIDLQYYRGLDLVRNHLPG